MGTADESRLDWTYVMLMLNVQRMHSVKMADVSYRAFFGQRTRAGVHKQVIPAWSQPIPILRVRAFLKPVNLSTLITGTVLGADVLRAQNSTHKRHDPCHQRE